MSNDIQKNELAPPQKEKRKSYLDSARDLPERKRKIILWSAVIIIGIFLFIFFIQRTRTILGGLSFNEFKEQLKIHELQEELEKMPRVDLSGIKMFDFPEMSEEEQKELEEKIKEMFKEEETEIKEEIKE